MEGFVDASAVLRGGVYVLLNRGEVVFVGKSSGPMLAKLAALRSADRPRFLPKITFDQVLVKFVHPDQIVEVYWSLIAEHQPRFNAPTPTRPSGIPITRRI